MAEFKLGRIKFVWKGDWAAGATYVKDDVLKYGGRTYVCLVGHVADLDFYNDDTAGYWGVMTEGFAWRGLWATGTKYNLNDVVRKGGQIFLCTTQHTSSSTFAEANFEVMVEGFEFENTWSSAIQYDIGDVVAYGGYTYVALLRNSNVLPTTSAMTWKPFVLGFNARGTYSPSTTYKVGDVVTWGGNTYVAINDAGVGDGPESSAIWDILTEGFKWTGNWADATYYKIGDVVKFATSSYIAKDFHTSDDGVNDPLSDTLNAYWDSFADGSEVATLTTPGDLLYRDGTGLARLPIGTEGQLLVVNGLDTPEWSSTAFLQAQTLTTLGNIVVDNEGDGGQIFVGPDAEQLTLADAHDGDDITGDLVSASNVGPTVTFTYVNGTVVDLIPVAVTGYSIVITGSGNPLLNGTFGIRAYNRTTNTFVCTVAGLTGSGSVSLSGATITLSAPTPLTDTTLVMVGSVDAFAQVALKNLLHGPAASTDFIAYADNGSNDNGYIDIGITSSGFDASSGYGITGINDGYIFMSAPANTTGPGNMVIATADTGSENDIVFCTGGFDILTNTDAEKVRIIGEGRPGAPAGMLISIDTASSSPDTGALRIEGGLGLQGDMYLQGEINAFGGAIYQGRKDLGGGSYENAKALIDDIDRADVTTEIAASTVTKDGTTLTIVYDVSATNLPTAVVGGFIEFEEGTFGGVNDALFAYNEILTHNTGTRTITLHVDGLSGTGTVTMPGDLLVHYYGPDAYVGLTNASGIFTGDADGFVQFALKNHNTGASASTDIIAYSSNGDNESGWIDMGITSETYADATYGVTGNDDGYIFMSAPRGTTGHGNLYLSTSENGTQNDVVISTNGFDSGSERVRIIGASRSGAEAGVEIYAPTQSTSTSTGALRVEGGIGLQGNLNVGGNVAIVGTISIGGSGSSLETTTLAVSDPMIRMGKGNIGDTLDLGFLQETTSANSTTIGAMTDSQTSVLVTSSAAFDATGYVYIEDEYIQYSGKSAGGSSTLFADIDNAVTSITVASGTSFAATGTLIIGSEQITYTGKSTNTLTGCTRGANGTTAASHTTGDAVISAGALTGLTRGSSGTTAATHVTNTAVRQVIYSGLVRDASDAVFKFFQTLPGILPTSTVDFSTGGLAYANTQMAVGSLSKLTLRGSSSGTVSFQGAAAAGSTTYTLPATDGTAGYTLTTNGSGTLSWASLTQQSDDTATAATYYPLFATGTTAGTLTAVKTSSSKLTFAPNTGTLTATIVTASSDARLKENVTPLTGALDKVLKLQGVNFNRIGSDTKEIGVIAQQVEEVVPELVFTGEDGMKSVAYANTIALLIEAIKEQQATIEELKRKVN